MDLDIGSFTADHKADLEHFRGITLRLAVVNHGTVPAKGTARIVGREHGKVVFSTAFRVTDAVGNGPNRYSVRVTHANRLSPGRVTWTVYLTTPGDVDGPRAETATASTTLVEHHRPHERF